MYPWFESNERVCVVRRDVDKDRISRWGERASAREQYSRAISMEWVGMLCVGKSNATYIRE
ncbi:hypothetical protein KSX_11320 [Ktedonospora formicarum]|uniref:Uncharacterized protein n=1 Tax=Ktedonospora formicarum TaxID=2778364 RepID=A0A8J3I133_9CHLR|nr:hypothetical protein KSX_11320 [Ktedonospora formicarum]